jgi:hypothetical protein
MGDPQTKRTIFASAGAELREHVAKWINPQRVAQIWHTPKLHIESALIEITYRDANGESHVQFIHTTDIALRELLAGRDTAKQVNLFK